MTDQSGEEAMQSERFGVSALVLEKARHLRDVVFPRASVALYIQDRQAYAVTLERAIVRVALLETLVRMSDAEVIDLLERVLQAHQRPARRSLRELRVEAGFLTQDDLTDFINEHF